MFTRFFFAVLLLWVCGACKGDDNRQTYVRTMTALKEGKARGHLSVTTGGKLGAEWGTRVTLGPMDTSLSFDGDVDYADPAWEASSQPSD